MDLPGFVDLQVNGYRQINFSDEGLTPAEALEACRGVLQNGTASFLPTMITSSLATYERNLPILADLIESEEFKGRLLGIHAEGPFLSPEPGAIGAHNPDFVQAPDPATFDKLQSWARGHIKLLTVAAERPGQPALIAHATAQGVTVSLGHQLATGEDVKRAADAGAKALTHLGNGIPHMINRHDNPVWDGLAEDRLTMMVIADGHHLPPHVLKVMLRGKGLEHSVIVSDASSLAGMPAGDYRIDDAPIRITEEGKLYNYETGYLHGSAFTMFECMNFTAAQGWLSLDEMLRLSIDQPLALIGLTRNEVDPAPRVRYADGQGFSLIA